MWPQEYLRELRDRQERAVGTAPVNEGFSTFLSDNFRALVMLEELHDERVSFIGNSAFTPIPTEYLNLVA